MDGFVEYILKILVSLLVAGLITLLGLAWKKLKASDFWGKLSAWFGEKLDAETAALLDNYIAQFTAAADQLVKSGQMEKHARLTYVTELLEEAGYSVNKLIRAKIESFVYELPSLDGDMKTKD